MEYPIYSKIDIEVSNPSLMEELMSKYNLDGNISMLPFAKSIGKEIRHLYYGMAVNPDTNEFYNNPTLKTVPQGAKVLHHLQVTRLFSFGECNAFCPYCKRDMQFIDSEGNVIANTLVPIRRLFNMVEGAVSRGEVVRFSGGDPVMYPKVCMALAEYAKSIGGTVSIAHNGSGPGFVKRLLPYMSSAAVDIKGPRRYMGTILGLSDEQGQKHFNNAIKTHRLFADSATNPNGALLDIRTPIFGRHEDENVPQTLLSDMMELGYYITQNTSSKNTFWTWRLYKPVVGCDWVPPILEDTLDMIQKVSEAYPELWMGIRAKWHGGGMLYYKGGICVNPAKLDISEKKGSGNTGECVTK